MFTFYFYFLNSFRDNPASVTGCTDKYSFIFNQIFWIRTLGMKSTFLGSVLSRRKFKFSWAQWTPEEKPKKNKKKWTLLNSAMFDMRNDNYFLQNWFVRSTWVFQTKEIRETIFSQLFSPYSQLKKNPNFDGKGEGQKKETLIH